MGQHLTPWMYPGASSLDMYYRQAAQMQSAVPKTFPFQLYPGMQPMNPLQLGGHHGPPGQYPTATTINPGQHPIGGIDMARTSAIPPPVQHSPSSKSDDVRSISDTEENIEV